MKKFSIKIILLSTPIILVIIVLEFLLRNMPNDYLVKRDYLENHAENIETLILGSSHALYGLNPEHFSQPTFNAAYSSQSLPYDYKLLQKFGGKFNNLKSIVLPASYFSLYWDLETGTEAFRLKNYRMYYGLETPDPLINSSEMLSYQVSLNVKRLVSYYILRKPPITITPEGWGSKHQSYRAKDLEETAKKALERHTTEDMESKESTRIFNKNLRALNDIIAWAGERNIKCLIVVPPAAAPYHRNVDPAQYDKTMSALKSVAEENDNCRFINLFKDDNYSGLDYYDADHLSEIGARKFSVYVDDLLKKWD